MGGGKKPKRKKTKMEKNRMDRRLEKTVRKHKTRVSHAKKMANDRHHKSVPNGTGRKKREANNIMEITVEEWAELVELRCKCKGFSMGAKCDVVHEIGEAIEQVTTKIIQRDCEKE